MHRLVCAVERAGLEVRDQVLWLYGSGLPKGRRLPGDLGTALKPAYEPVLLARVPLHGTTAENVERFGTGTFNIGETRVRYELRGAATPIGEVLGRWPANLGLIHSPGCGGRGCEGQCAVRQLDVQTGRDVSRFFYAAKATRQEREAGLADLPAVEVEIFRGSGRQPRANVHPTVKPLSVMRWLVRLVAPVGGVVLDPFSGSGSTGCAALLEHRQFVGIEREEIYVEIARRRLAHWSEA
jgi:site-specific DNA-methyltransferase (adenine-specific)